VVAGLIIAGGLLWLIQPRLRVSRENAERNICASNMRQVGLAFQQYTRDFDGKYPIHNVQNVGVTVAGSFTVTHWVQALQPYAKSVTIFSCPAAKSFTGTAFYLNLRASGAAKTKLPSTSVLLTEGPDTSNCAVAIARGPVKSGDPPSYARHGDGDLWDSTPGSNYLFIDGHVEFLDISVAPEMEQAR
jgi:prepilin-type processing-associated H-X9-DG protein